MLVERLKESDTGLYLPALESLRTLIRTSTSSMTSVPKPLKFLRPHYEEMGTIREGWAENLTEQRVRPATGTPLSLSFAFRPPPPSRPPPRPALGLALAAVQRRLSS